MDDVDTLTKELESSVILPKEEGVLSRSGRRCGTRKMGLPEGQVVVKDRKGTPDY